MEQSKLSKPVLPPGSNTLAKDSSGKVYDIPGSAAVKPPVAPSRPTPVPQAAPQSAPIPQQPMPQVMQNPMVNRTPVNNVPVAQTEQVQPVINQVPAQNANPVMQPPINSQSQDDLSAPIDQGLDNAEYIEEDDFEQTQNPGYIDPIVLQQRLQAQRRDLERENNVNKQLSKFTSPKPLTNDSLKYLVGIAVLSIIIYLIMRVL